jgi:hypothetical protein
MNRKYNGIWYNFILRPDSHCGGRGSVLGQSMLTSQKQQCNKFFLYRGCVYSCICGINNMPVGACSSETWPHPIDTNINKNHSFIHRRL